MSSRSVLAGRRIGFAGALVVAVLAAPLATGRATASPIDPNPGRLSLAGSLDLVSTYMFRGLRQNATGACLWPTADLGFALHAGEGAIKSAGLNLNTWNSLHSGDTGADGPAAELWYESDFSLTLGLGLAHGASLSAAYVAYTSPNNSFSSVKELDFKLALDDSGLLGRAALRPYGLLALELDTALGAGQADGGSAAGRYLEFGVAPGYAGSKATLSVPVKVGLSLADYYERNTGSAEEPLFVDERFGFFSVGAWLSLPLGEPTAFGAWNLHAGLEHLTLGDTTDGLNGGDGSRVSVTGGIGLSY